MYLHHRWRLLCHHQWAIWCSFLPSITLLSSVLSMVLFLRSSCCFPSALKTRSIPPPDPGQPWNCLHILTTSGYVRFTWSCSDRWASWTTGRCLPDWSCHSRCTELVFPKTTPQADQPYLRWRGSDCCLVRLIGKTHLFLKVILITRWFPWAFPVPCHFNVIFFSRRSLKFLVHTSCNYCKPQ